MASYTPNYGLHQWVPEDNFQRTDFNEDLSLIDTALQNIHQETEEKCELISGSFTGTAQSNTMTEQEIVLGFQPKAVFIGSNPFQYGADSGFNANCVLIYPGIKCSGNNSWQYSSLEITENGFLVAGLANQNQIVFQYIAIR